MGVLERGLIVIPKELTDLNSYINAERRHRMQAANIKKRETNICIVYLKQAVNKGFEIGHDQYPLHVIFRWYAKDGRKDLDNIAYAKKYIMDAMQKVKLIENDGYKQVQRYTDIYLVDKEKPRVEIEIRSMSDGA